MHPGVGGVCLPVYEVFICLVKPFGYIPQPDFLASRMKPALNIPSVLIYAS